MRIIEVDLHTRQQSLAMLNTETGELIEKTLEHDGHEVRKPYSALPGQVLLGIEAIRSMHWFFEIDGGPGDRLPGGSSVEGPCRRTTLPASPQSPMPAEVDDSC
jgi:hypothetical protein